MHTRGSTWLYTLLGLLIAIPFFQGLFAVPFQMVYFLAIVALAGLFLFRHGDSLTSRFDALDYLVWGLALLYLLSPLWAANPRDALQEGFKYASYAAAYWMVSRGARNPSDRMLIVKGIALSALLVGLASLAMAPGWIPYPAAINARRLAGPFQYPNTLAAYMFLDVGAAIPLLCAAETRANRWVWGATLYTALFAMLMTYSRTAWLFAPAVILLPLVLVGRGNRVRGILTALPPLAAVAAVAVPADSFFRSGSYPSVVASFVAGLALCLVLGEIVQWAQNHRWVRWLLIGAAMAGLAVLAVMVLPGATGIVARLGAISLDDASLQGRLITYQDAIRAWWQEAPFTGLGGAGWKAHYRLYRTTGSVIKLTHSSLVETLVEVGIQGALLWLGMWVLGVRKALVRSASAAQDRLLYAAVASAVLGVLLHSLLDFDLSFPAVALPLWVLIGVARSADGPTGTAVHKKVVRARQRWVAAGLVLVSAVLIPLTIASWAYERAAVSLKSGDVEEALRLQAAAVRLDPINGLYASTFGDTLLQYALHTGSMAAAQQARDALQKAVRWERTNPDYRIMLANYHMVLAEDEQAYETLKEALQYDRLTPNTYFRVVRHGMLLVRKHITTDQTAEAEKYLNEVGQIFQMFEDAYRAQPEHTRVTLMRPTPELELYRAQWLIYTGQDADVLTLIEPYTRHRDPGIQAEAWYWTAVVHALHGNEEAERQAQLRLLSLAAERIAEIETEVALIEAMTGH